MLTEHYMYTRWDSLNLNLCTYWSNLHYQWWQRTTLRKLMFPVQATKTLVEASEQTYSSFVCTPCLTMELNQKLSKKSMLRRHLIWGVYICKNLEVKAGGGCLLEGGIFLGTYSTSVVPRPHPLTIKIKGLVTFLVVVSILKKQCYAMQGGHAMK